MSNIEEYTKNFKFMIPEFNVATWHTEIKENFKAIDALIANFVQSQQYQGAWKQVTSYLLNDLVYISDEDSDYYGYLMRVKVNHTTTGDDFDTFLANNPTYYEVQGEMGAQIAALRAQDWAEKTDGMVVINEVPIDYSAKAYAIGGTGTETNNSKYFKEQAELACDTILEDPGFIAIKADFLGDETIKTVAENIQYVQNIDANLQSVVDVSTNIEDVNTLASNLAAILTNATNISSINTNATNISNINTVASNMSDVNNCSTNMTAIQNAPTQAANAAQSAQLAQEAALSITNGYDLLDHKWSDHLLNDQNWLRADTFSWQPATTQYGTYLEAYNHLIDDIGYVWYMIPDDDLQIKFYRAPDEDTEMYAWTNQFSTLYTEKEFPENGDNFYYHGQIFGTVLSTGVEAGSGVVTPTTETIGSYTITYYPAEDGHKIVLPDQETTVQNIYNESGVAWYYILDTTNQRFKLPRSRHGNIVEKYSDGETGYIVWSDGYCEQWGVTNTVSSGNSASATYPLQMKDTNYTLLASAWLASGNDWFSYAFQSNRTKTGFTTYVYRASGSGTDTGFVRYRVFGYLDSYPSNSQYQYLYFYVGQFTQTATEQTAGLHTELFTGKVDLNLNNMNPSALAKETIVGWGMPDYSAGVSLTTTKTEATTNGYILLYTWDNGNVNLYLYESMDSSVLVPTEYTKMGSQAGTGSQNTVLIPIKKGMAYRIGDRNSGNVQTFFLPCLGG